MTDPHADRLAGASTLLATLPERRGFGDATLIRPVPGSIDLGGGNPSVDLLPTELYRDATHAVVTDPAFGTALRYSAAQGLPALRAAVAARERVDPERIVVTNGGAHGLALAVLGTLDRGDTIVVDDPVYPLFLRVLDLVGGVNVVAAPVTADGIDVDAVERLLRDGLRPKALFTVPTFQNPAGGTLSTEASAALVDLAERFGFTIIADDPYREVAFPGVVVPDRPRFRDTDRVVGVNTFSKTLGPGLRLGWLTVPESLRPAYTKLRNRLDGQTSGVLQSVVARMLADPRYDAAVARAGAGYEPRARALAAALRDELAGHVEVRDPDGGFFVWARLDVGAEDSARLFDVAQDAGVVYQRGEWFAAGQERFTGFVRLSFSEGDPETLREGVARLATAWRTVRTPSVARQER
ncbi:putative transcriptional regulator, GntR family [Beutenbergia cavernae DSM 12333]|uniref:Putative transcriptional regulator, GntR family n=1 Tax=Beutenbergia cavernae (strain ATCC BAA-8 / DSM 12333 / CCUG 43141 / JCM 11478 / NBRC 16432 / NCIMB 13614 / HKI 0122) TaxID=471853 RepID=C5BX12_BEUC1|nr:PLP-dependent aminotransferase family protein [Beutenbergia cavernae]ACQ78687.1 putative transcriptional regulator, GntR family [Beutenbergia cavernae DSM 12333]